MRPLVWKSTSSCLAGARLPLPETTDCTTPRVTATVREETVAGLEEPTLSQATATAPAARTASAGVRSEKRRGEAVRGCLGCGLRRRRLGGTIGLRRLRGASRISGRKQTGPT